MIIDKFSLYAIRHATGAAFTLENAKGEVVAQAQVRAGAELHWREPNQDIQGETIDGETFMEGTHPVTGLVGDLLGESDPVGVVLERTLSFVETKLGEGFDSPTVDVEGAQFILHAKSRAQTNRSGAPRPIVRSRKTRVWI